MPNEQPQTSTLQKAGMVLFGDVNGVRHVVAPYSEGRFGNNFKYYVLGKGAIDAGENVLEASMRECSEETGIDIKKLLGEEAIAKLSRGEPVENMESGYPGVRIKQVVPNALQYTYRGRHSVPLNFAMFAVELEGIEHLQEHLKNQPNRSHYLGQPQEVYHPVRTLLAMNPDKYPSMQQCLDWLRTMRMPQAPWSGTRGGEVLPAINGEGDHWFADLEAAYMESQGKPGEHICRVSDWQNFQKALSGADYSRLSKHADQIKKNLIDLGVISGDDKAIVKFDTKDCPLVFYQEGCDILTADNYLKSTIHSGLRRSDFSLAFCGDIPMMVDNNMPRVARICGSQFAGVVWAVGEQAIENVAARFRKDPPKTREDNKWLGGNMYDDSLRQDLLNVLSRMQQKEVPMGTVLGVSPVNQVSGAQSQGMIEQQPVALAQASSASR